MAVTVTLGLPRHEHVALVELDRPPHNFLDSDVLGELADALELLDADPFCRAVVLASAGRHFCAGADLQPGHDVDASLGASPTAFYDQAARLFATATPIVAAVQGAAIGAGLGLALAADFRVATPESRFSANFARLGLHHGFGLSATLPPVVGNQRALELLYTGRRIDGAEARAVGLCDRLVAAEDLRVEAGALAGEIADAAPLAVRSIRRTMRGGLLAQVRDALTREFGEQAELRATEDFQEGLKAGAQRRAPRFTGR